MTIFGYAAAAACLWTAWKTWNSYPVFAVLMALFAIDLAIVPPHGTLTMWVLILEGILMGARTLAIGEAVQCAAGSRSAQEIGDAFGVAMACGLAGIILAQPYVVYTPFDGYRAIRFALLLGMTLFMLFLWALWLSRPFHIAQIDQRHYAFVAFLLALHPLTAFIYALSRNWAWSRGAFLAGVISLCALRVKFVRPAPAKRFSEQPLELIHAKRR